MAMTRADVLALVEVAQADYEAAEQHKLAMLDTSPGQMAAELASLRLAHAKHRQRVNRALTEEGIR